MMRWLLALVGLSVGCSASHKLATVRHTPCRTRDVRIEDVQRRGTTERWMAYCEEKAFECEAISRGDYDVVYRCRPAAR